MEQEIWKQVPGYGGRYEVSSLGRVKSNVNLAGGIMKPTVDASGYPTVELGGRNKRVHDLVVEAFHGARNGNDVAMHGDGNKMNNSLNNISWGSRSENVSGPSSNAKDSAFDSIMLAMLSRR